MDDPGLMIMIGGDRSPYLQWTLGHPKSIWSHMVWYGHPKSIWSHLVRYCHPKLNPRHTDIASTRPTDLRLR